MTVRIAAALWLLSVCARAAAVPLPETALKSAQRHYLRGSLHEHRGDLPSALKEYEAALSFDPGSVFICREAADLALEMEDADKAMKLAQRLQELDPGSAEAGILIGRVLWARGELDAAQSSFEEALRLDPQSSETILSLGSLLSERSPQKARELLNRFIKERPEEAAEAYYQLAKIEFSAGRGSAGIGLLKTGIELQPESLPLRYALAQAYEADASTDAALGEYLEILKLDTANTALMDHIGEIYFQKGQLDEARSRFEDAHRLQPSDPFSSQWLSADAERQGDWAKAAELLQRSSALAEDPGLALRLSYYQTQAGRLKDAVATLEDARARWPQNDQIGYFLALGYDDLKEADKAVKTLRRVLEFKPDFRDARYQLGAILEKVNRMAEAEAEFRQLLADKPDDASALNYLGYSLADRGLKLPEAESLIREALRLSPTNGAYLDSLGWVLFKQGRSTEAVSELSRALNRSPDDDTIWEHIGDAYSALGNNVSAWRAWKRSESLSADPAAVGKKAAKGQKLIDSETLGGQFLAHLAAVHGTQTKMSALCVVSGEAMGRRFSYNGMLTFRGPSDLSLDLLGPLFAPMFRIRMNEEGFLMDPIRVEGVKPEVLTEAAYGMFTVMREFLSGRLFSGKSARYKKGWRSQSVEAGDWRLGLDDIGMRVASLEPKAGKGKVGLDDFVRMSGYWVPRKFTVSGFGYSLSIKLEQVKAAFETAGKQPF